jgi:hypothetical protein
MAGIGARCAQRDAAQAARSAAGDGGGQGVAEAAVAAVTARLHGLPQPVTDAILDDTAPAEVARLLAFTAAWMIDGTDGGEQWLRRWGLAVAKGGER